MSSTTHSDMPTPGIPRRSLAMATVTALLVAGLVTVPAAITPPAAAAAVPLPEDAEAFRVSQTETGASTDPAMTPDGQRAAFVSTATDLVAGDGNGLADVFLSARAQGTTDPFSGATTLISAPDASMPQVAANGPSSQPAISADGRYVAFLSSATNLTPGAHAPQNWVNVYVRDTVLLTTTLLQSGSGQPEGDARGVDMSDDGRFVTFVSDAPNLSPGDLNETWDGFIVDMDADGNGTRGDLSSARVLPDRSIPFGVTELVISGNGDRIAFATHTPLVPTDPATSSDYLYQGERADAGLTAKLLGADAYDVSIDSTGEAFAYISDTACPTVPTIIASTIDFSATYSVAIGWMMVESRTGTIDSPIISADGSTVAWETTRPGFSFDGVTPAYPDPVIRIEEPAWNDSNVGISCTGVLTRGWTDIATGTSASLSASGRTLAYSHAPADTVSIVAVDRHTHGGLSVMSVQGETTIPGYMRIVDISLIPISELRDYAAALANAPIHRLPIHRLPIHRLPIHRLPIHRLLIEDSPIHRLPIHRLPIHRLPIHRLDIPGGWPELLADTPFGGELVQSVTLAEVLEWAAAHLAQGTPAEMAAAARIKSLTLQDVDLDDSGIDGLSLASFVLGGAPLAQVEIPGSGTPTERWQAVLAAQGLAAGFDDATLLADLDAAGLNVGRSGIEDVALRSLPVAATLFDTISMDALHLAETPLGELDVATLTPEAQNALFGSSATGTLDANRGALLEGATVADLATGAPADLTFGTLLFSLLDAESYPWEQIAPASIDPRASIDATSGAGCNGKLRCETNVQFRYTFDPGPGEPTMFAAPTASVTLPVGTAPSGQLFALGSGPLDTWHHVDPYAGPVQNDGNLMRLPLPDMPGGTTVNFEFWHTETNAPGDTESTATLTSGTLSASSTLLGNPDLVSFDDPTNNWIDGAWDDPARPRGALQEGLIYYEWISPAYRELDDEGQMRQGPAYDEDYFLVDAPAPGKRLVISTNATDGQIAMALFSPSALGAPLGVSGAGPAPGTAVTEQSGSGGSPAEAGGDAAAPLAGHSLVDQASVGGDGTAQIEAASTDVAPGEQMLLRVTSGNGLPSSSLYSLRARYLDEPAEAVCTPWAPAQTADPGVTGTSDAITADTNTLYLFDTRRFGDTYGATAAAAVRAGLDALDGTGRVGDGAVDGAVLSVDADPSVQSARATLDANPCSMSARRALTAAINAYVSAARGDVGDRISSVVLVGGDDIVPLAPVAQHTGQFNEASHSADLRRATAPDGSACPASVAEGAVDACATPLSAAAATNYILTDDAYGLADAYQSLGGFLYVPTVGVGRLIETPAQITATLDRFVASNGVLAADSTLTGGYGAWSELPEQVTENLSWRSSQNQTLTGAWNKGVVDAALFPDAGASPRVVSINTHADETRMIPGIPGAEDGRATEADMFTAAGRTGQAGLAGSLVFMIGCHAGGNLPTAYYGDVPDWADVFSSSGGFVGNTGFGLANSVTTALSERLLGLYADWVGVESDGIPVSAAGALTYAKQSYLGGLGLYSGYDEKVLMQAVYYGLPMYTFTEAASGEEKGAPLPSIPGGLSEVQEGDGLLAASLSLSPQFTTKTETDASGKAVSYLVADGQDPLVVAGQPILPRVVSRLAPAPDGLVPRGALITGLTSERVASQTPLVPAIAQPSVGVAETAPARGSVAFPSTFATITRQQTSTGPIDLLVTTPGRVEAAVDGTGILERFTTMNLDVVYGPADATDTAAPVIRTVDAPAAGRRTFEVIVDGTGSEVAKVTLLAQPEGENQWRSYVLTSSPRDFDGDGTPESRWVGDVDFDGPGRWMVQAVDAAGNVAIESARGHLDPAGTSKPTLAAVGDDATVTAGGRLLRTVAVEDAVAGERLAATFTISTPDSVVGAGAAVVETGSDGITRVTLDRVMETPGTYTVTVSVCRGDACTDASFGVQVLVANSAPSATVELSSNTTVVWPSSTLTATGAATDPDDDATTLTYRWDVNGGGIPVSGQEFDVSRWAVPGDVITVTVTPNDGSLDGHVARAEVVVQPQPEPPAAPAIALTARTAGADYAAGTWSTTAVTIAFECTSGVSVTFCPEPVTVSEDTDPAGITVSGTTVDSLGRSVTASILVRLDKTAPTLAPVVSPNPVLKGATATAAANAADAASGIDSQSCETPGTATVGSFSVACAARDVAGNTATASALYVVKAPLPTTCGGSPDRAALAPLNADGSSVFLRSSWVPIIFRACDANGKPITTKGFVTGVTLVGTAPLAAKAKINELWYLPLGSFGYSSLLKSWVGTIPTLGLAGGKKYTYRVSMSDGSSFTVTFGVR